jgi:hypothetical protein
MLGAVGSMLNGHISDAIRSALRWAALVLVVLIGLSAHTRWKQRKAQRRVESQCGAAASAGGTIFVALVGEHGSTATAQALFALLDGAACPRRVRVGLYELIDTATGSALDMYRAMAEKYGALGTSFHQNVTVMQRMADDQGPYAALCELMQHAYASEAHVLTLTDAVHVQRGWDTKLLELLARTPAPSKTCLVLPPSGGFTVVHGFEDGVPAVGTRPWAKLDGDSLPRVKFWTRCASFAPAAMWHAGQSSYRGTVACRRHALRHLNAGTDIVVSAEALAAGWVLRTPARLVPSVLLPAPHVPPSAWPATSKASRHAAATARNELYSPPLAPALAALGLHATANKDAVLGVVDARDEGEIEAKYASVAEFLYIASKV